MNAKVENKNEKTTVILHHTFELYKENSDRPLVQVQMNVEYNPLINEAKAVGLFLNCNITKSMLDMTMIMHKGFFQGIIAQEIAVTDWKEAHIATMTKEYFEKLRIADNVEHDIEEEVFVLGENYDLNDDPGHEEYLYQQRQNY